MFCHSCVAYKKFYEAKWTNIPYSKNKLYIWSVIFLSSFWISEYSYETWRQLENCNCQWHSQWSGGLESKDAAPEVPHLRSTRQDATTREGCRCPRPTASCQVAFVFFLSRLTPTCGDVAPTRADSRWIGPTRAWIGRIGQNRWNERFRPKFKKQKKKVQNAPFELNIKPSFSSLHTNTPNFLY